MTMVVSILISLSLVVSVSSQSFNASTIPIGSEGSDPLVSATEGSSNVNLTCEVTRISDGVRRRTVWTLIRNGSADVVLIFSGGVGQPNFENFLTVGQLDEQLTILNFNSSFDYAQLGCGAGSIVVVKFDLRIIKTPILINGSVVQVVAEGNPFSLNSEVLAGFPVVPDSFNWFFNSIKIFPDSSNPNISDYPYISFDGVNRSDDGNYTIIVSNEGGTATGFFILEVHYKPEGEVAPDPVHVVLSGDDTTLVAFINIDGNPEPVSTWSYEGNTLSGIRFNDTLLGRLTISSVSANDSGNYTNTLRNTVNGNLMTIVSIVELIVAESPSMPRDLMTLALGAEFANISWRNPANLGTPSVLSLFRVETVSIINTVNVSISATSTKNLDFINVYVIAGLKPNTEYTVTVKAISTVEQLGVLISQPSESLIFNTSLGAPAISSAVLANDNGNLSVSWEIRHTGGSVLVSVTVHCSGEGDEDSLNAANADPLVIKDSNEQSLTGSISLGPITAGANYSCLITAENSIGRDELRTEYVLATTGLPSQPVILKVLGGSGSATITLRMDSFGVLVASDFTFVVSVFSPSDTTDPVSVRMITPDSIVSSIVTIVVEGLSEGTYVFTVTSRNIYSPPLYTLPLSSQVFVNQRPITTSRSMIMLDTTPSFLSCPSVIKTVFTTSSSNSSSGLSGGVIGGIIIASLLLLAVIGQFLVVLLFFVYKTKVIKEVNKSSSKQDLSALQLTDLDADYKDVDRVYDQPEHSEAIGMKQNIAYGEVTTGK